MERHHEYMESIMNTLEVPVSKVPVINKLKDDIEQLTDSLTVGNYFWTMEIINHKKAQIERIRNNISNYEQNYEQAH